MIRLGDVSFGVGANTLGLRNSVRDLQNFGRAVDRVQTGVAQSSQGIAHAMRRQEQASVNAYNSTIKVAQQMGKFRGTENTVNQVSKAFQQLNNTMTRGQLTTLEYQRAMERWRLAMSNAQVQFKNLTQNAQNAEGRFGGFRSALQGLQSSAILVQGPLGGIATRISNISALLGKGGFIVASFIAGMAAMGYTLYKVATQMLDAGKKANAMLGQFEAATGSLPRARGELNKVTAIARQTGQSIDDIGASFARFQIASKDAGMSSKEIRDAFVTVGSAATKLQLNSEQTQGIFRALEQMMSKGTIQAEELRGQLGDRLPGAVQIMARAMGVSTQKLGEMMKAGELLSATALPKFFEELRRSLNIGQAPIDNYTASVNNLQTAMWQFWNEMNNQFKILDKVQNAFKRITAAFDTMRESIPKVRDAIRDLKDWYAVLSDEMIKNHAINQEQSQKLTQILKLMFGNFKEITTAGWAQINMATVSGWLENNKITVDRVNKVLSFFYNLNDAIAVLFKSLPQIVALNAEIAFNNLMTKIKDGLNSITGMFKSWFPEWSDPKNADKFWMPFPFKDLDSGDDNKKIGESRQRLVDIYKDTFAEIQGIMGSEHDIIGGTIEQWKKLDEEFQNRKQSRNGSPRRGGLSGAGLPGRRNEVGEAKSQVELTEKEIRALNKQAEALRRINDEISNTYDEIDALGGTQATLESLNDKFKREKEIEKYARALKSAGVEAGLASMKVGQLREALEIRDVLEKEREGLEKFRDSLTSAFDSVGESIVDGMFESKNALQSFGSVAKSVGKEIAKMYVQLAILNPLKNSLFGTNEPTLQGGWLGKLLGITSGQNASRPSLGNDPWAGLRESGSIAANQNINPSTAAMRSIPSAMPNMSVGGGNLKNIWRQAIHMIESGGQPNDGYGAIGPTHPKLGRALGRYQIMEANIPSWSKRALGRSIGVKEFMANPDYQDAIFDDRFGGYVNKFGDPGKAAQAWLGGEGSVGHLGRKDVNGTSIGKYEQMFNKNVASLQKLDQTVTKSDQTFKNLDTTVTSAVKDVAPSLKDATKGIGTFGKGMQNVGNQLSQPQAASNSGGGLFGWIGKIFGNIFGGAFPSAPAGNFASNFIGPWGAALAKGGVLSSGRVIKRYNKGDVFNQPTAFPMAQGAIGMLGEAGSPEAVMPLQRTSDGSLGVAATIPKSGGNVIVQVINQPGQTAKVSQSKNGDDDIVSVVIQAAKDGLTSDIVKGGTPINSAIESRYNLKSAAGIKSS